jgi:endonuclease III
MKNLPSATVSKIMDFYNVLEKDKAYVWVRWSDKRRKFTFQSSNAFIVGVMLDQGQKAERAWDGGRHIVKHHFQNMDNWWEAVHSTHHATVRNVCQKGFNGTSYASVYTVNKFPKWLRSAASKIVDKYEGDPRNIWKVSANNVDQIYDRFIEFDGIGDALAKMAQFILLRNYGIAGGVESRNEVSVKPDALVRRVLYRSGISPSEGISKSISIIEQLPLASPANFDAATWIIGREYCLKSEPKCTTCPIRKVCKSVESQA